MLFKNLRLIARLATLSLMVMLPSTSFAADDLLLPVRQKLQEAKTGVESAGSTYTMAELLLDSGRHDEAYAKVSELLEGDTRTKVLAGRILLASNDLSAAGPLVEQLIESAPDQEIVRRLAYRWWRTVDDLEQVDRVQKSRNAGDETTVSDRLAAANLSTMLLDFDGAVETYLIALGEATTDDDRAATLQGLGVAQYRKRDFDSSLDYLTQALAVSRPSADLLMDLSNTLIRLGRTQEAIEAATLATEIAPYHERAHYMLGNGYAHKNYTELHAAYPHAFSNEAGKKQMNQVDEAWATGNLTEARAGYMALHEANPGWADVLVRLGSLDFAEREYIAARKHFAKALVICPEYGRAHNGMAKALEAERLTVEVHRAAYEAAFEALPMPEVERIEEFIVNWSSLSPRHQKRVALSVEPWKRYLPVLIASGSTHYIKPLYELLSETPGQEVLRDQRISYDSRLWDDVRGCGGYNTVTGIEDVERTIQNRYNTVLHELSHQVHAVLSADRKREIQELYRKTKERDQAEDGDAFLSRYAGGSVWEYLAEGANALLSPRRDSYDTREVVRERLDEMDKDLRALVLAFMNETDVDSCYPVAYSNRGDDLLGRGSADDAILAYQQAIDLAPDEETALSSLIYALTVAGRTEEALTLATAKHDEQPESASLALVYADALWCDGMGLRHAIRALEEARETVREEERNRIDLELGRLRWVDGDQDGSLTAYLNALEYQADDPRGLWGMAQSLALSGDWEMAWTKYEEAVRIRTGVVELRADYARDLLRAKELERARDQVEAGLLLDPEDPKILSLEAWVLIEEGDIDLAKEKATYALEVAPWSDFARIMLTRIELRNGNQSAAARALTPLMEYRRKNNPPVYVYRPKWGRWDQIHYLPKVEADLLDRTD